MTGNPRLNDSGWVENRGTLGRLGEVVRLSLDSALYLVLWTILGHDGLMLTDYVKRFKTL